MRITLTVLLLAVLSVSIGAASPVLAPPSPACSSLGSGPANDISLPYAVWTAANFNCEQGDKIFSNFLVSASLPTDTRLELQTQTVGGFDLHGATFNGNFINAFLLSYDIAVDLTLSPNARIVRVSGDLSNPSAIGNPATTKTVFTEGGTNLGTIVSQVGTPGTPLIVSQTALHITDAYAPLGGAAVSISNTFAQSEVPEATSFLMIASGLGFLSRLKRKKPLGPTV